MADAYLVLWIKVDEAPPTIVGASIYSESHPSTDKLFSLQPHPIMQIEMAPTLRSYERAKKYLVDVINTQPFYAWLRPLLKETQPT